MTEETKKINKGILIKIAVPILIVLVVIGIYIFKKAEEGNNNSSTQVEKNSEDSLPLEITSVDLEKIKSYGVPFVIDFGSDSCIPCKEMAPVLETLHEEFQDKAVVHFVDVWKNQTAATDFPVSVIPTQVFYNADGTPYVPSEALSKEIEFTFYNSKTSNEHLFTVHQGGITEEQMRKIFAEMGVK
ncbi:thioredoxin family protein [Anaerosacchariphilus polymeriproducens]|uniref:Thioredoxin n=1 Tax=Anaerosacchariphilus polymeriproducens TaxID=1812858 RepID=A0A371AX20_9FIRM|nr:thioredoxin family protein [Anaerosacchariphilus polymeriproducens]RDU24125.1 thioredoxin [Anaerosacchariphilus polymeriproducens]